MKHTKSYKLLILLLVTAFLHGCIDDPVDKEGTVEGTVYDQYGMYNPSVLLSVGDYPIVSNDIYGHFTIENSTYPYDLTVSNHYFTQKYIGLALPNPQIYTFEYIAYGPHYRVITEFPGFNSKFDRAFIKFISNDLSIQFDYNAFKGSPFSFNVEIRNDRNQIEGKIIFLQFTYNDGIISYDKFGMKDVVLNRNNQTIVFTEEDIKYNPKELFPSFHLQVASGEFDDWISNVDMELTGMNQNSGINLFSSYEHQNNGTFVIPELPMLNYRIKFTNYARSQFVYAFQSYSQKWVYVKPGENINMSHAKSLTLQLPLNDETNVNDNTKFIFTDNNPGGVYIYRISPDYREEYNVLDFVTDKYPLTFKDFKTWGYQFKPNIKYYWGVVKYPGYKDVNDFAASKIWEDSVYTEIPASEWLTFKIQQ